MLGARAGARALVGDGATSPRGTVQTLLQQIHQAALNADIHRHWSSEMGALITGTNTRVM